MATTTPAVIWFRRSDGEKICASDGSEACKYMRRESGFEELNIPTSETNSAPSNPAPGAAPKDSRKGAAPKDS